MDEGDRDIVDTALRETEEGDGVPTLLLNNAPRNDTSPCFLLPHPWRLSARPTAELGIGREDVKTLACFPPFRLLIGVDATPVIAVINRQAAFRTHLNPREVSAAFSLPLEAFLGREGYTSTERMVAGRPYVDVCFKLSPGPRDCLCWADAGHTDGANDAVFATSGFTAWVCVAAAAAVFQRQPDFPVPSQLRMPARNKASDRRAKL